MAVIGLSTGGFSKFVASGGGAAGSAAPPFLIFTAVLAGVSIVSSLTQDKPSDPPPEAAGIPVTENPTDPNAPWLVVYGELWIEPPKLFQYLSPDVMNTLQIAEKLRLTEVWHLGTGPIDGRNLSMKRGGTVLFENVAEGVSEAVELTPVDSERKRWKFPVKNVDPTSVVIYEDGTNPKVFAKNFTDGLHGVDYTQVTDEPTALRTFSKTGVGFRIADPSILSGDRKGAFLPTPGVVDEASVVVKNVLTGAKYDPDKIQTSTTDDPVHGKKQYFYSSEFPTFGLVKVSYRVLPKVEIEVDEKGDSFAVFEDAIGASVTLTATFRTKTAQGFRYFLRTGEKDQAPLKLDEGEGGHRNVFLVGSELTQGTPRTYTTADVVDDLVIGIESGPEGLYDLKDGEYRSEGRYLTIRVREDGTSGNSPDKDPANGWVQLRDPNLNDDQFFLFDTFTGTGTWFFSVADLLEYTRTGKLDPAATNTLKPAKYEIEVTGVDAVSTLDRIKEDLFLAHVTEVRRVGLVIPYQADAVTQVDDDSNVDSNGVLEVRVANRKVWVPDAGAVYDSTTRRPGPGTRKWSRNPVWCACDHIVDPIGGGGRRYTWSDIDLASALAAAAYCDESVTLPDGASEVRSECDIAIGRNGEREGLFTRVGDILKGSQVLAYWSGTWRFVKDEDATVAQDPVNGGDFHITDDDVEILTTSMDLPGIEDIPSELLIAFRDRAKDSAEDNEPIPPLDPVPAARVVGRVEYPGVSRRSQVARVGALDLRKLRLNRRQLALIAHQGKGMRILSLQPGDVILVTSTRAGVTAKRFKVMARGWGSGMKPALLVHEDDRNAYGTGSIARPTKTTSPTPAGGVPNFPDLTVSRVGA